ncbi:hypothetical protein BC936DRAFT_144471 [Jimgerdemannia flammicorona]|uniref:Uncharacterized protein n=2 Tax=Jimgerdemannia flammicorona TaxID=994334 RepID=A0A433QHL3_9FUNG|nr:hypothetical protein BC936DRAFT_144471 [Jimgerdemannia flammicorona]RUS29296.1 hypothetical protein BC938DRAFT_480826 [Jimgerdemannia flammicorona]
MASLFWSLWYVLGWLLPAGAAADTVRVIAGGFLRMVSFDLMLSNGAFVREGGEAILLVDEVLFLIGVLALLSDKGFLVGLLAVDDCPLLREKDRPLPPEGGENGEVGVVGVVGVRGAFGAFSDNRAVLRENGRRDRDIGEVGVVGVTGVVGWVGGALEPAIEVRLVTLREKVRRRETEGGDEVGIWEAFFWFLEPFV